MAKRTNWQEFKDVLDRHNIHKLYHFTDRDNLEAIIKNGGLYSWKDCEEKNRLSRFLAGIIFYTREVLLTSHYEKRLFEHASQPRVAGSDIRLLFHLWSRTNLSRDSYQSG